MTPSTPETKNNNESPVHLKNRVEQSVALLCKAQDATVTNAHAAGSPDRRSVPIHIDASYLQKGALVDAATALATLWKVPSRAKLPNRALQYSR
jgi:hypothetical protein